MSKNFELLQRIAGDDFFEIPKAAVSAPLPQITSVAIPFKRFSPDTEITKLVQRLFPLAGDAARPKAVAFSGITRGDRSAWICARAGEALAERGNASVCIVEANFFSPQVHSVFDAPNQKGLAEALVAIDPILNFATPIIKEKLWLLSSGLVKPGFSPSFERQRERFAELREAFDYLLISAPPLSREADATLAGQLADGVVLIVEANRSRRETVRRAKEQLESARVRLLGAVLDQRTFPIPERLYQRL